MSETFEFVRFRTAAERRDLVGREVEVTMNSGRLRACRIIGTTGRNLEIDEGGLRDWLWVPDILQIVAPPPHPTA